MGVSYEDLAIGKLEINFESRWPSGVTDLSGEATRDIAAALNGLLADVFALYLKTENFHWHMSGPHFRDYHLLLDEQGEQIFAMIDPVAERVRKIGGTTLRSVGHIARIQRIADNDAAFVEPQDMLAELRDDNLQLTSAMRQVHNTSDEYRDGESTRGLDRRNRAPQLVSLRGGEAFATHEYVSCSQRTICGLKENAAGSLR